MSQRFLTPSEGKTGIPNHLTDWIARMQSSVPSPKPSTPLLTEGWMFVKRTGLPLNPEIELTLQDSWFKRALSQHVRIRSIMKRLELEEVFWLEQLTMLRKLAKEELRHGHRSGSNVVAFPLKKELIQATVEEEAPTETESLLLDLELKLEEIKQFREQLQLLQDERLVLFKKQHSELRKENRLQAELLANKLGLQEGARKQFVKTLEMRGLYTPQVIARMEQYYKEHHEEGLTEQENAEFNTMRAEALRSQENSKKMTHVMELNIIAAITQLEGVSPTEKRQLQNNIKQIVRHLQTFSQQNQDLVQSFKKEYVDHLQDKAMENQRQIDALTPQEVAAVKEFREGVRSLQARSEKNTVDAKQLMTMLPKMLLLLNFEGQRDKRRLTKELHRFGAPAIVPVPQRTEEAIDPNNSPAPTA